MINSAMLGDERTVVDTRDLWILSDDWAIAALRTPLRYPATKDKISNQSISARIFARTSASSSGDIAPFRLAFLLRQSRLLT